MKKNYLKDNAVSIIIGLILLSVNIFLDLGILPMEDVKNTPALIWILSILSKIASTVGLALIIGFVTNWINSSNIENQRLEDEIIGRSSLSNMKKQ